MPQPRLVDGNDCDIMLRNLRRMLAWGTPIAEARHRVLHQARVSAFPRPPARASVNSFATLESFDTSAATIH